MWAKDRRRTAWVAAALLFGTVALYWPATTFDFTNLDDNFYILFNDHVRNGLNWPSLRWSFQAGYCCNWHPVTWMSHMVDCQLFGLHPGPPHGVNVLLHAADSALLFVVLKRLTQAFWRSATVAAFFALHPLHVESVAWVAERKDVLSAFFWMLILWTYVRYVEHIRIRSSKSRIFYTMTLLLFALGLMAKPMLITLPFVLLLLDWWPLGRWVAGGDKLNARLILEKLPFFALSAGSGVLTLIAQSRGGAMASLSSVPFETRLWNALVCYLRYVEKLFWPAGLSVIYPLVSKPGAWEIAVSLAFLTGISALAFVLRKSCPYWTAGWLWYIVALLPVIGLIQVGLQSMSDRYVYLPSIGIFIIICWAANDFTKSWKNQRLFLTVAASVGLAACGAGTISQLQYWRNSGTLFQHALALDPNNYVAHSSYGAYLRDQGQLEPARLECQKAVEIAPRYALGYTILSGVLYLEGRKDDAIAALRQCLDLEPALSAPRAELAKLLLAERLYPPARKELEEGLKFHPEDPNLHFLLGHALALEGNQDLAQEQFIQGLRLAPDDAMGHYYFALTVAARHDTAAAIAEYRAALQAKPDFADALNNLAWILAANPEDQFRNGDEAVRLASRACALTQTNEAIKIGTLANACAEAGRFQEALDWARKAGEVALAHGQTNLAARDRDLQQLYETRQVFHEKP
jgi:tetratricopeptide (TPR) repeat protein